MDAYQLDKFDYQILDVLSKEGRISVTDLAPRVGLSATPCMVRMKKLQEQGVIVGYAAILDQTKLGREHVAFTEVKLRDTSERALQEFNQAVRLLAEVEQCHMIAGPFDYLLKVRTSDIFAYRRVLGEKISNLPHVSSSSTFVAMESVVEMGTTPAS